MDFGRAMLALRRRRWAILAAVIGCTAVTYAGASRMQREYLASATLMAQDEAMEPVTVLARPIEADRDRDDITGRQDRIKTVASVLSSPAVVARVIEQLNLKTVPAQLQERIEVKELTSQVLRVSVRDTSPDLASSMVNRFVAAFMEHYGDLRSRDARSQMALLEREQSEADRELRTAGARLEQFKKQDNISSLPEQTRVTLEHARLTEEERDKAEAQLRDVSAQLASVQDQLTRTPATREIRESATQTKLLDQLGVEILALKSALARELASHTEAHPNVRRLNEQLEKLQRQQSDESAKLQVAVRVVPNPDREALMTRARDLRNERDGLLARVGRLNGGVSRLQGEVSRFAGKDVQLALLTDRYQLAEQRLKAASERLAQIRNAAGLIAQSPAIAVVDQTGKDNPPVDLSQGRTLKLTALAFVMSLAACILMAIGLDAADRRVRSVEDVEDFTRLPVISVVPQLPGRTGQGSICMTTESDPAGYLAESYHFLANHILRQTRHRESSIILGVTGRPGQGATTALSNLAVSLAKAGRRVVLVEADLRRPQLHEVFEVGHRPGLTDVLLGKVPLEGALAETAIENLRLMPAGSLVKDPWSLLRQPSMAAVLHEMREAADYVVLNVPSATVFPDALCVAPLVDGAILVMRAAEMPNGAEQKVRQWLEEEEVPLWGVVLNGVPTRDMDSYEFHRSYTARRADDRTPALAPPAQHPVRRLV